MNTNVKKISIFIGTILITTIIWAISWTFIKSNFLSTKNIDKPIVDITKKKEIKKIIVQKYENSYILVNWLPLWTSSKNRNMLIALVNTSLGTINFIPYNYYTWDKINPRLSELSNNKVKDFFTSKGINIVKQISIDQDNIANIYKNELSKIKSDVLPSIELKDKTGKTKKINLWNSVTFYDLIKSNIRNKNDIVLEQLYLYIIKKMSILNHKELTKALEENKTNMFYNTEYNLELTKKNLIFTPIIFKGKKILVDKNFSYLEILKSGKFKEYKKQIFTDKEIKQLNGTYKMTLKEKLKQIREKRKKASL